MLTFTFRGMDVESNGYYDPGYHAPNVSNPDAAGFADPGAPAELSIAKAWFVSGGQRVPVSRDLIEEMENSEEVLAQF